MGHVDGKGRVYVNAIFNTHPHDDHVLGIIKMLKLGLKADRLYTSFPEKYRAKDSYQHDLMDIAKKKGLPVHQLKQNEQLSFGKANLQFFWCKKGKDPNQLSACTRITYGDAALLLTGDITNVTQRGLQRQLPARMLKADIMKMPHHGLNICEKNFLNAVRPQLVFASNRLRSTPRVAQQMKLRGIKYLCHSTGRIVMETDGKEWYVFQRKNVF